MPSNYPPGVTGNEPQIRGMNEVVLERKCNQEAEFNAVGEGVYQEMVYLVRHSGSGDSLTRDKAVLRFNKLITEAPRVDVECPFEGKVDAQVDEGTAFWECPVCMYEHEEELDMEPDPDRFRI